jgi:O-antigen biosynthesis protein WbqV
VNFIQHRPPKTALSLEGDLAPRNRTAKRPRRISFMPDSRATWAVYAHDLALAAVVMAAVLTVRYLFEPKPFPYRLVAVSTPIFALICAVVFPLFRLHRSMWRFTALNDVLRIAQAVVVADLLLLPVLFLTTRLTDFPRSAVLIVAPVLTAALAAGRVLTQAAAHGDLRAAFRFEDRAHPYAVVVGSPGAAAPYMTALRRDEAASLRVAGIVALDGESQGRTIHGAEVLGGLSDLRPVLENLALADGEPPQIVVAEPRPSHALLETIVAVAGDVGARVSRIRPNEPLSGRVAPLEAADLLDRPPRRLDSEHARALIEGKRVLVTGAGGTIGSELVRQALQLGPARLTLLDASEFNLYALDQALLETGAPPVWTAALADVRDLGGLEALFDRERPEVVLHAAALKHVPLMEMNPAEAVLTNVGGAINITRLARDRCEALVFVSTDKAVNPTNVMGATKRIAERCVRALAAGGRARVAVVRFGNVLGSTGSVVPLFERQIASGGPVTVTHPEMVRYFMTVQEAASLVLRTGTLPESDPGAEGRVYVLDMGEPVRIDHLARQLIRLHGLKPDVDIAVAYTGLRPGEKLSEEIFYEAEDVRATGADGVWVASDPAEAWTVLEPRLDGLLQVARSRDDAAVLEALQALEPAFRPSRNGL